MIYSCDQGTSAVVSIADAVLNDFCRDEPGVGMLFDRSDNCYSGKYQVKSVYKLCKSKSMHLIQYDYNEPQCGNDQCDQECDAANRQSLNSWR